MTPRPKIPEIEASAALVVSRRCRRMNTWPRFKIESPAQQEPRASSIRMAKWYPSRIMKWSKSATHPRCVRWGGPLSVTPCESETCRGFTIQFAPSVAATAGAEARVFDGPARSKLCDTSGTDSAVAEPVAHEESLNQESLDEIAARLQRDFLAAMSAARFQIPAACSETSCKEPACTEKTALKKHVPQLRI